MILPKLPTDTGVFQIVYAIFVILLIPGLLIFNTLHLLNSSQRDTDFELNNKALLVESVIAVLGRDQMKDPEKLSNSLNELTANFPEIKAIEVYDFKNDPKNPLVTTSNDTKLFSDPVLNQLAWGSEKAYSKQIMSSFNSAENERVWMVAEPITDKDKNKLGLIVIYISAKQIDELSSRTTRDSLLILEGSVVLIILLLLNHFSFIEKSRLYLKLREVDKLKDDFISVASHELRAPLTAIGNYAYLLAKNSKISADQTIQEYTAIIIECTHRLNNLISDMLDVSRIEQKRMKLDIKNYDLREIIKHVVKEYSLQAQEKHLILSYTTLDQPLIVSCDQDKMTQIVTNLISNAIKYTPSGEVTIFHQIKDKQLTTFFKDTGVGMSAEAREKLFSKFYRIYNEKTQNVPGTGLGLWITKQLIEQMGGKILVDSIENQGSQFTLFFKLQTASPVAVTNLSKQTIVQNTNLTPQQLSQVPDAT